MARVLVIDDEIDLCELYRLALESGGHEIVGIFDRVPPSRAREAKARDPEVIILDERLGLASGLSFLADLRGRYPGASILLASADPDAVASAVGQGADAAMKKPFPMADLIEAVYRLTRS